MGQLLPLKALNSNIQNLDINLENPVNKVDQTSVVKLQAMIRGMLVRKAVANPTQLRSLIENHIPSMTPEDCKEVSLKLAKLFVQNQTNPGLNEISHNVSGPQNDFEVEFKKCGVEFLAVPKIKAIGSGTFKEVFAAKKFDLTLPKKVTLRNEVLMRTRGDTDEERAKSLKDILHGIKIQERLLQLCPDAKIMSIPRRLLPKNESHPSELFSQAWVNGSLKQAMLERKLPLSPEPNSPTVPVPYESLLKTLVDVSETLEKLHAKGVVHRDVKVDNILVAYNDPNENKENSNSSMVKKDHELFDGILSDFDIVDGVGFNNNPDNYYVWDSSTRLGFVTPFCDVYGLTIAMAIAICHFTWEISDWRERLLQRRFQEQIQNDGLRGYIKIFIQENPELLPFEKRLDFPTNSTTSTFFSLLDLIPEQKADRNHDVVKTLQRLNRHRVAYLSCIDFLFDICKIDNKLLLAFLSPDPITFKGSTYTLSELFKSQDKEMKKEAMVYVDRIIGSTKEKTSRLKSIYDSLTAGL